VAIDALHGWGRLEQSDRDEIWFRGWLEAQVVQSCVVSLEDVPATVRVPVERGYRRVTADEPARAAHQQAAAHQVDEWAGEWDDDVEPLRGTQIDLGEMLAEELALALDPYPRAPDADILVSEALGPNISFGSAEPDSPFAALEQLQDKRAR
jgi:uncharacterized metal-binding protein YceD (DUF177 family)